MKNKLNPRIKLYLIHLVAVILIGLGIYFLCSFLSSYNKNNDYHSYMFLRSNLLAKRIININEGIAVLEFSKSENGTAKYEISIDNKSNTDNKYLVTIEVDDNSGINKYFSNAVCVVSKGEAGKMDLILDDYKEGDAHGYHITNMGECNPKDGYLTEKYYN